LKHQIPIRTYAEWEEGKPGFIQVDLVGHDGGNPRGDFAFSLDCTDVHTGWTEPRGIQNKAQKWTFEALCHVKKVIPFDIFAIGIDNGSEFLNAHLIRYCQKQNIQLSRTRPYRKNDNCYVEQKNNSVIRRYAGYLRYDTDEQLRLLNEIYDNVRLFVNFFQPSMKLISKSRQGSKVIKRYDTPQTPYQRVLTSEYVSEPVKYRLRCQFETLNPVELHRRIRKLQAQLLNTPCAMGVFAKEAIG